MMHAQRINRRSFVGRAGFAATAALFPWPAKAQPTGSPGATPTRIGIDEFAKDPQRLASLRAGVKAMRDLAFNDPTHPFSWTFQANIHLRPAFHALQTSAQDIYFPPELLTLAADPAQDPAYHLFRDDPNFQAPGVFGMCPHHNWWFFPWHRGYLYCFERILRSMANDPRLVLPYWNYTITSDPDRGKIPAAFREVTADGQPNPLYVPDVVAFADPAGRELVYPLRDPDRNAGTSALGQSSTSAKEVWKGLDEMPFYDGSSQPVQRGSFGGAKAASLATHPASGGIEAIPHDTVHDDVGGANWDRFPTAIAQTGFMGALETAARDPLFWLHHCNIDRLWDVWIGMGGGRHDPNDPLHNPDDRAWLKAPTFQFYDVDRQGQPTLVRFTSDGLSSAAALGYAYDDTKPPSTRGAARVQIAMAATQPAQAREPRFSPLASSGQSRPAEPTGHAIAAAQIHLTARSRRAVSIRPVDGEARGRIRTTAMAAQKSDRLILTIEGLRVLRRAGVHYMVFVNLPPGAAADIDSPHYITTISFFSRGHDHGREGREAHSGPTPLDLSYDVTDDLRRLLDGKAIDPAQLEVTFVPNTEVRAAAPAGATPQPAAAIATIERVRFMLRQEPPAIGGAKP